jgi:hypothetical protein
MDEQLALQMYRFSNGAFSKLRLAGINNTHTANLDQM